MTSNKLPALGRPPITEVVCGVVFDQLPELDAFEFGRYWETIRDAYPNRQLQPAIVDGLTINVGTPTLPMRAWMFSQDEVNLIQLQRNRFYLNWRAREDVEEYPRFTAHGDQEGLLSRMLDAFEHFSLFCEQNYGRTPTIRSLELGKINTLRKIAHWTDRDELMTILPFLEPFTSAEDVLDFNLSWARDGAGGRLVFSSFPLVRDDEVVSIRLDLRGLRASTNDTMRADFAQMNEALNHAFFGIVPEAGREAFDPKEV